MINVVSYLIGYFKGRKNVILDGDGYSYTDSNSDGNIVIEEAN